MQARMQGRRGSLRISTLPLGRNVFDAAEQPTRSLFPLRFLSFLASFGKGKGRKSCAGIS
jgi:hypothetical protein